MQIPASRRLTFRLLDKQDAELLFRLDQDPAVMQYINGGVPSSMQDIVQRMLPRMQAYRDPVKGFGIYGVFAREALMLTSGQQLAKGDYLGWVLVRPMNFFTTGAEPDDLELGWRFFRHCWRQGIASEAAATVAAVVAKQPGIARLSAIALPDNHGSVAVMQKLGMSYVKRYIHRDPLGDYDVVLYSKPV